MFTSFEKTISRFYEALENISPNILSDLSNKKGPHKLPGKGRWENIGYKRAYACHYNNFRAGRLIDNWKDFETFYSYVGDLPLGKFLTRPDIKNPFGPRNFQITDYAQRPSIYNCYPQYLDNHWAVFRGEKTEEQRCQDSKVRDLLSDVPHLN
jgi:hypothetical protein